MSKCKHAATLRKWLAELQYYTKVRKPVDKVTESHQRHKKHQRRLEQGRARAKRWYLKNRERQLEYYRQWHKKRKLCNQKNITKRGTQKTESES